MTIAPRVRYHKYQSKIIRIEGSSLKCSSLHCNTYRHYYTCDLQYQPVLVQVVTNFTAGEVSLAFRLWMGMPEAQLDPHYYVCHPEHLQVQMQLSVTDEGYHWCQSATSLCEIDAWVLECALVCLPQTGHRSTAASGRSRYSSGKVTQSPWHL